MASCCAVSTPCRMALWLSVAFVVSCVAAGFAPQHSLALPSNSKRVLNANMSFREKVLNLPQTSCSDEGAVLSRRSWLSTTAFVTTGSLLTVSTQSSSANAAETIKLSSYQDADCGFQVSVPSGWNKSEQTLPDRRRMMLFQDPDDAKTLLFIAYTPIRDDYTSLSSFGTVDSVAQTTILPKGEIAGDEETKSEMLKAESKKNAYFFDYKAEASGQPMTHFRAIFSLAQGATGGAGAVLVTLTAQTPESRYGDLKSSFDSIMDSYGKL